LTKEPRRTIKNKKKKDHIELIFIIKKTKITNLFWRIKLKAIKYLTKGQRNKIRNKKNIRTKLRCHIYTN
jgi:hypothetical protein